MNDPAQRSPLSGYAIVVAGAAMFAWLGPLSRWAYAGGMEPIGFVAWRAGIGALVLAAVVVATRLVLAAILLGEVLRPLQVLGAAAVLAAALLLQWSGLRRAAGTGLAAPAAARPVVGAEGRTGIGRSTG